MPPIGWHPARQGAWTDAVQSRGPPARPARPGRRGRPRERPPRVGADRSKDGHMLGRVGEQHARALMSNIGPSSVARGGDGARPPAVSAPRQQQNAQLKGFGGG
eukprot:13578846-Alexandrium_andersonii.AAC.1